MEPQPARAAAGAEAANVPPQQYQLLHPDTVQLATNHQLPGIAPGQQQQLQQVNPSQEPLLQQLPKQDIHLQQQVLQQPPHLQLYQQQALQQSIFKQPLQQPMLQQVDLQPSAWGGYPPGAAASLDPFLQQQQEAMHQTEPIPIPATLQRLPDINAARAQLSGTSPSSISSSPRAHQRVAPSTLSQQLGGVLLPGIGAHTGQQVQQLPAAASGGTVRSVDSSPRGTQHSLRQQLGTTAAAAAAASQPAALDDASTAASLLLMGASSGGAHRRPSGTGRALSPKPSHGAGTPGIVPQASVQVSPMSRATSMAASVSVAAPGPGVSKLRPRGRTVDSDDTDYSSSDNDDDYEFGEAKIKRTFTRQQRRQRKQQQQEQQQQQQQQQLQQAVQAAQLQRLLSQPQSPRILHGRSDDGSLAGGHSTGGSYGGAGSNISMLAGSLGATSNTPLAAAAAASTVQLGSSPVAAQQLQAQLPDALKSASFSVPVGQVTSPFAADAPAAAVAATVGGSAAAVGSFGSTSTAAAAPGTLSSSLKSDSSLQQQDLQKIILQQRLQAAAGGAAPAVSCEQAAAAATVAHAVAQGITRGPSGSGYGDTAAPGSAGAAQPAAATAADGAEREASFNQQLASGTAAVAAAAAAASAGGAPTAVTNDKKDQAGPSELQAEFQGLSLFDDQDDDDDGDGPDEQRPWYKRPQAWFHIVAFTLSAILLLIGVGSQFVPWMNVVNQSGIALFRWMYFFAAWPILWVTVNYCNNKLFAFIEWLFYRDALYYLDSVRRTARNLVFMCLVLPWYVLCFWTLWCSYNGCEAQGEYKRATDVVWKLLVCLTLFTLANFLKSFVTKLMSTHFYRTAHFRKVKDAIEKEYYLLMLSQPRPKPAAPPEPSLSRLSYLVGYSSAAVTDGGSHMMDKLKKITVGDPEGEAGGKAKLRAKSDSGAEWEHQPAHVSLATKSVNFLGLYSHNKDAAVAPTPEPVTNAADRQAEAAAAAAAAAPNRGRSGVWGMRTSRSQPWLDLPPTVETVSSGGSGGSAAAVGWEAMERQQSAAAGPPVPIATVQLAEQSAWKDQEVQQRLQQVAVQQDVPVRKPAHRWAFWRRDHAPDCQQLLEGSAAYRSSSSEHAIAIKTGTSPPTAAALMHQQVASRAASLASPRSPAGGASAPARRGSQDSAAAPAAADAATAAAATGAAGTPRTSMDKVHTKASHVSSIWCGSAGGKPAGRESSQVCLGRTGSGVPSTAAAAAASGSGVSDPLLQADMLEKVNILGGKQVDASTMKAAEWERLRTGIALKTFTALMKRYQHMSEAEEAKKLREARRFAKGLFYNIRGDASRPFLIRDDFSPFFDSRDMADQAFAYFDKDNDAQLTIREMKDSVTAVFKERKNMAHSLKDTHSIVNTLELGIGFLFHFIFAAIYLLVWGMDIVKGFSTFSATVLALTFVFGNSVRQIYESMLFLFVEHAFDVGDLLEVELVQYRVKKIDLMFVVLVKSTGERVYYPTTRLITLPVINLTRSTAKSEKVMFLLDVGKAGTAAREALLECVKRHYEENESDFNSCPSVNFVALMDPFKVQLSVVWTYNFGPEEFKRTSMVKTGLLQAISDCLGSLESLEYTLIKATDAPAAASSKAAAMHDLVASGQGGGPGVGAGLGAGIGAGVLGPNSTAVTGAAAVVGVTGLAAI